MCGIYRAFFGRLKIFITGGGGGLKPGLGIPSSFFERIARFCERKSDSLVKNSD